MALFGGSGTGIVGCSLKDYFSHFRSLTEKQGLVADRLPNMYKDLSLASSTEIEKEKEEKLEV